MQDRKPAETLGTFTGTTLGQHWLSLVDSYSIMALIHRGTQLAQFVHAHFYMYTFELRILLLTSQWHHDSSSGNLNRNYTTERKVASMNGIYKWQLP